MASLARLVALLALGGCGRLDFAEIAMHGDGGGLADAPTACLGTGLFMNLHELDSVSSAAIDNGGEISRDGLAYYFGIGSSIAVATRMTTADAFSAPVALTPLNGANASDPSVTADGLEIFFDSSRSGGSCLFRSTRASVTDAFDAPVQQVATCTATTAAGPAISADGLTLLYNSTLDGFGEGDVYITHRAARTDEFPAGTMLANLPADSGYAWMSQDKLRLYFEHTSTTSIELYSAFRISPSDDFTNVQPIVELDDGGNSGNVDISLDPTESVVYFATDRGGMGDDIWTAERPCL